MGVFDMFGGMVNITPIMQGIGGLMLIVLIGAVAYFTGALDGLMGKYKTTVLCFEKRQGRIVFVGSDKAWPHRVEGEMTYTLKQRKINIPPPPIEYIHLVNGINYVFVYFPDRDEGHPFALEMHNTENLIAQAMNGIEQGKKIETKDELINALKTLDDKNLVKWNPVVEDSTVNLVTTQLQKNAMRYQSNLEKMMKYLPIVATIITLFVIIVGFWLVMGKMDDIDFTVTCMNTAGEVAKQTIPYVPEMP